MTENYGDSETWASSHFPSIGSRIARTHGAFHDVIVGEATVARVLRGQDAYLRAVREMDILKQLPGAFALVQVPQLRSDLVEADSRAGYLTTRITGEALQQLDWHNVWNELEGLLHQLRTAPLPAQLPQPRAWCGGPELGHIVAHQLAPILGETTSYARELVERLTADSSGESVLVHGDFGPHNLLWRGTKIVGLLDWDHATIGDPAMDVAPLIGYFGAAAVGQIVDDEMLDRAMRHRATLSLQVAAAAQLSGLWQVRDHACRNFLGRLQAGTLYDPSGRQPA